jgi:hypothetical protein
MSAIDKIRVVQLTSPVDTTSTTVNSDVIGTKELIGIKFVVSFGTITGDTVVVTVEECDDTTPSNSTAIAYSYSKDGAAIGTDTAGAWTAVASTGVTIADTDDDKNLIIKVDPAALTACFSLLCEWWPTRAAVCFCLRDRNQCDCRGTLQPINQLELG